LAVSAVGLVAAAGPGVLAICHLLLRVEASTS
jgi:hypothetical protein